MVVWHLRRDPLFEDIRSFEAAGAYLREISMGTAALPEHRITDSEFLAHLASIIKQWALEEAHEEKITWDGEPVSIELVEGSPSTCRVWGYDFTKVDAGTSEDPDEIEYEIIR